MKAWIISDMHVTPSDFRPDTFNIPHADVCICAGDVSGFFEQGFDFLAKIISPRMPVVAVLGNHDFFGNSVDKVVDAARRRTAGTNIQYLENEVAILGDVRIIGATLWTDFEVPWGGEDADLTVEERRAFAINFCRRYMLDFREIFRSDTFPDGMPGLVTSRELIGRHLESKAFIKTELEKPWPGKTVVVSHHAPSPKSLLDRFRGHPSNAAFASDLTNIFRRNRPDIWVHGHIHQFFDYLEGGTRIVCNPVGYRHERGTNGYRLGFVIDL